MCSKSEGFLFTEQKDSSCHMTESSESDLDHPCMRLPHKETLHSLTGKPESNHFLTRKDSKRHQHMSDESDSDYFVAIKTPKYKQNRSVIEDSDSEVSTSGGGFIRKRQVKTEEIYNQQRRCSERLHSKSAKKFQMPSRKSVFDAIPDISATKFTARRLDYGYSRINTAYNAELLDPAATSAESDLGDFIVDDESEEVYKLDRKSSARKKKKKKYQSKRFRRISTTYYSSDSDVVTCKNTSVDAGESSGTDCYYEQSQLANKEIQREEKQLNKDQSPDSDSKREVCHLKEEKRIESEIKGEKVKNQIMINSRYENETLDNVEDVMKTDLAEQVKTVSGCSDYDVKNSVNTTSSSQTDSKLSHSPKQTSPQCQQPSALSPIETEPDIFCNDKSNKEGKNQSSLEDKSGPESLEDATYSEDSEVEEMCFRKGKRRRPSLRAKKMDTKAKIIDKFKEFKRLRESKLKQYTHPNLR